MRVESVILALLAAAASAIAVLLWRTKVSLHARLAELVEHCETADLENERLRNALSAREDQECGRVFRLEHDLKSPLGVILGFSMLLREYLEGLSGDLAPLPLRSINGIDQAAQRMVRIIESAAEGTPSPDSGEEAVVEENTGS
jgi:signal transduction histidine kinase